MTYAETLEYLYTATPLFQREGATAYKPGLATTEALDAHYGHPHRLYPTIHVAGTNGKGSTSHTLAAVLQCAGYRVGLFTSPHLVDFRERIRVDGEPVSEEYVVRFVQEAEELIERYRPSFFEITTLMALKYFAEASVDIAVIEVGLGGRLDSTNIIRPSLSIITGISRDHTQYLGDTLEAIAGEKAGIIKPETPVIVGRADEPEVERVFTRRAEEQAALLRRAYQEVVITDVQPDGVGQCFTYVTETAPQLSPLYYALGGTAQRYNLPTILTALDELRRQGWAITDAAIRTGLREVVALTGLRGRWEVVQERPLIVCDTGHNEDGIRYVVEQLRALGRPLHLVFGMVNDKDITSVLALLPQEAAYYFTAASVPRALPSEEMQLLAGQAGLRGEAYPSVSEALAAAREAVGDRDEVIFIGGSNFIVADLLELVASETEIQLT